MRRRDFIAALGSAMAFPLVVRAQQPAMPMIGYLGVATENSTREVLGAVHRGLSEAGFVERQNLAVEYRWAEDRMDRLPGLAASLVSRGVAVIIAISTDAALASKAATQTIPIVFVAGGDPVSLGLVASLSRPGGNLTGMSSLIAALGAKRLQLLHQLVPSAMLIGYLVNPANRAFADAETTELKAAALRLGVRLMIVNATDPNDFEAALASLAAEGAGGLVVSGNEFFTNHRDQLVPLANRHGLPAVYGRREGAIGGGLISYGTDFSEMYRQAGLYAGRILKGEKPTDLPVQQVTKMSLAINMKSAKALGLTVPETLLATADEVIE